MKLIRGVVMLLAVILVIAGVTATEAQASAEGPFFVPSSERAESEEKIEVSSKDSKVFVIKVGESKIECKSEAIKSGEIVGSASGNSQSIEGTIEFSSCSVAGNGEKCEVEGGKITTANTTDTLAFANSSRTGKILAWLAPASGSLLATVHFSGSGCKIKSIEITGSVASEVLSSEKAIEVEKEPEEAPTADEFIYPTTAITAVWIEKEGKLEEETVGLKASGKQGTVTGGNQMQQPGGGNVAAQAQRDNLVADVAGPLGLFFNNMLGDIQGYTYRNIGRENASLTAFVPEGAEAGNYKVNDPNGCTNKVLSTLQSCTIDVELTKVGSGNATIRWEVKFGAAASVRLRSRSLNNA